MEKVQPNELRIVVDGGIVQKIGMGKTVPSNLRITLTDYDLEDQTPEDDPRIEEDGYGDLAFCAVLFEPGDQDDQQYMDEDETLWL